MWLHGDTFLGYNTSYGLARNTVFGVSGSGISIQSGAGRDGVNTCRFTNGNGRLGMGVSSTSDTCIVGMPIHILNSFDSGGYIFGIADANSCCHILVHLSGDGRLRAYRVNGVTVAFALSLGTTVTLLLSLPAGSITVGPWYALGVAVKISDTAGYVKIYLNGEEFTTATNIDTKNNSALAQWSLPIVGKGTDSTFSWEIENWFVFDGSGSTCNAYPGDLIAECLRPNGVGDDSDWTPNAGVNYDRVDDLSPDGDTTIVQSSTVNNQDTYTHSHLTRINTGISFAQLVHVARKTSGATRAITQVLKSGATTDTSADRYLDSTYGFRTNGYEVDPDTSTTWDVAGINDSLIGQKVTV